jgi:hypothetical protein
VTLPASQLVVAVAPDGVIVHEAAGLRYTPNMKYIEGHRVDETRQCEGLNRSGKRCKNPPIVGGDLCPHHDPAASVAPHGNEKFVRLRRQTFKRVK